MQHCPYCRVDIAGDKECCPLCGGPLTGQAEPESEVFPALPKSRFTGSFVLRLAALIGIVTSGVCVLVNYTLAPQMWWSLFVIAGSFCLWLAAAIGVTYRRDLMQNITWQVFLVPGLSVLWDVCTGWRGWSITFVLPCVCATALMMMLGLAVLLRLPVRSWVGFMALTCLLGLTSAVWLARGLVFMALPSLICSGLSLGLLCVLVLFHWQVFKEEFARRFHL